MLSTRIIPCLDIKDGRVVKGVQFVELRDAGDPIEAAKYYAQGGADELCFLDIGASAEGRDIVAKLVSQVAQEVFIPFTVGGGLRTLQDIERILHAGADKVSINTAAFLKPEMLREAARHFGSQCIVCAIDVRRSKPKSNSQSASQDSYYEVYLHGGRTPTGKDALEWAREACENGAGEILLTSMDKDGTGAGYDLELIRAVRQSVAVPIIASGGVGGPEHLCEAVEQAQVDAVLAASIFHFKKYTIAQVKAMMAEHGLAVRVDDGSR